ncbi:conjugal transfer mating pair stabilization protein TraN [Thiorhodovibrio winogradskyi]|uniref:conjugal transfer mating pair stabilization protein TraN n=1 Tax=Thiorhodovibrio winogradskyi TaxID=77007 RepID=UPI002E2CAC2C|nr:conjugal transfer mating pair stabilization protein TraN [Thiorhodovibrio winogradskyi]
MNAKRSHAAHPRSPAYRLLASLVSLAVAWTPWALVWGDELADLGREGQAFGASEIGVFVLPQIDGGTLVFPGHGGTDALAIEGLFPGASAASAADFSACYGNAAGLGAQGQAVQADLLQTDSAHGSAFDSLHGGFGVSDIDLRGDPLWSQTDPLMADMAGMTATFTDCSVQTAFTGGTRQAHLPEIETCQQVQQGGSCRIGHTYTLPPAETSVSVTGGAELITCGHGCVEVVFDIPGSDPLPSCDTCGFPSPHTFSIAISEPTRVERIGVSLTARDADPSAVCDADCRLSAMEQVWELRFPGYLDADTSLDSGTPIRRRPLVDQDHTVSLRRGGSFQLRNVARFATEAGQWHQADGAVRIRLRIALTPRPLTEQVWDATRACIHLAETMRPGAFCSGSADCIGAPALDADGCYSALGVRICAADFGPSPVPWLSPFCREIAIEADCAGFNAGEMDCWTDPQGERHCPFNPGDIADDCGPLVDDPACQFVESACVEGARDPHGLCYVTESRFDCGSTSDIPTLTRETDVTCAGPVRCLGDDCLDLTYEQSDDFAEAAAALQAAEFVLLDSNCTAPGHCEVFSGIAAQCKQAVGGVVDCCETPQGIFLVDYIQLMFMVTKVDAAIMASESGYALRGSWEVLRDPLVNSWDAVTDAFTTAANNLMGKTAASASEGAARLSLDAAKQAVMRQTAQWVANIFGDAAANALFVTSGGGPAVVGGTVQAGQLQLGGLLGTTLSWIMTACMIYTLVMILIRIIWKCEQHEFELGAKRQLRSCHYVGSYCKSDILGLCIEKRKSYCCFNSPLARIINEQARAQSGHGWGSAKNPDCSRLSLQEMERLDWERIDLSEWLAILAESGQYPIAADLDIETLTGTGSELSTGARADAAERSVLRAEGLNGGDIVHDAAGTLREQIRADLP